MDSMLHLPAAGNTKPQTYIYSPRSDPNQVLTMNLYEKDFSSEFVESHR